MPSIHLNHRDSDIRGLVVAVEPADACMDISPPPRNGTNEKWIALIKRYNCTFYEKSRIAEKANYDAVVIYNEMYNIPEIYDKKGK